MFQVPFEPTCPPTCGGSSPSVSCIMQASFHLPFMESYALLFEICSHNAEMWYLLVSRRSGMIIGLRDRIRTTICHPALYLVMVSLNEPLQEYESYYVCG
jgi:hypothetical protein